MPAVCRAMMKGPCVASEHGRCVWCDREMPRADLPDGLPGDLAARASGPMPHPDESTDEFARRVAAVRRIKRGLMAAQDKAVGIDTSHMQSRPRIASLPALQAQIAVRHDLPMRVVADMLDEIEPMLELLARVRGIVDAGMRHDTTVAYINGFADIRDALYPNANGARTLPQEPPPTGEDEDEPERDAWRIPSDIPEGTCNECGAMLHDVRGYSSAKGGVFRGLICLHCHPLGRLFRKGEGQTLEQDVRDAVERGEVDDDEPEPEP